MNPVPKPTPIVSITPIYHTSRFTPVNKVLPSVEIPLALEIVDSTSIKMASDTETPVAAGLEAMDLSTPVKKDQNETAEIQTPTPTPTPRKRGRAAKGKTSPASAPKAPTKAATATATTNAEAEGNGEDNDDASDASASGSPSKKGKPTQSPTKKALGPIPTSFEVAGISDRLILRMRDEEKRAWPEINTAWMKMTGVTVGKTTLRMRHSTMKSNFVSVDVEDEHRLISAKKEVEERFESEKWNRIAEMIHSHGGKQYPAMALQKKFKAMMSKAGGAAAANPTVSSSSSATVAGAGADDLEEDED